MLRFLQTSDVRLGARHPFLGDRAGEQRERQMVAFERLAGMAVREKVDLLVVAGNLFASATEPRATVERASAALAGLVRAGISAVIVPGETDAAGGASLYAIHDLAAMAGVGGAGGAVRVVILTDAAPRVELPALGVRVTCRVPAADLPEDMFRIGVLHVARRLRDDEIAGAGVDYLAIGGLPALETGRAGGVSWGASGPPELASIETDRSREVLLVTLEDGAARPKVERGVVGRTRFERLDVNVGGATAAGVVDQVAARADPDLALDVRLVGTWADSLDLDVDAMKAALASRFLQVRVRNQATPPPTAHPLPPAATIPGAFVRDLEARIAAFEAKGDDRSARDVREALRIGRRLLLGAGAGSGAGPKAGPGAGS